MAGLTAIGLVNGAWRNTCVENWHAEGRMDDGDMLRVNSHTTWRVRQLMRRWMREADPDASTPAGSEGQTQLSSVVQKLVFPGEPTMHGR